MICIATTASDRLGLTWLVVWLFLLGWLCVVPPQDIFREFFGGGGGGMGGMGGMGGHRGPRAKQRGQDLQADVKLNFMEAVKGTTRDVTVNAYGTCGTCDGKGSSDGKGPQTCTACGGSGERLMQQGFFTVAAPCGTCNGQGSMIVNKCGSCRGTGRVRRRRTVQVTVPPGVDTGVNLRLSGEGDVGPLGGPKGHMYVHVHVHKDAFFRREGTNVHVEVSCAALHAPLLAVCEGDCFVCVWWLICM